MKGKLNKSESEAFVKLKFLLGNVVPHERCTDSYDLKWIRESFPDVFIEVKPGPSVTMKIEQLRRLKGLGEFVIWVGDTAVSEIQLIGTAHVHTHDLNQNAKTVCFRVVNGVIRPPAWCALYCGSCDGLLQSIN